MHWCLLDDGRVEYGEEFMFLGWVWRFLSWIRICALLWSAYGYGVALPLDGLQHFSFQVES